jgi:hypothetical protein
MAEINFVAPRQLKQFSLAPIKRNAFPSRSSFSGGSLHPSPFSTPAFCQTPVKTRQAFGAADGLFVPFFVPRLTCITTSF